MRLLFINFTKTWGGGESWHYQVMCELRKRGHQVILLSNANSAFLQKASDNQFETHSISVKKLSYLNPVFNLKLRSQLQNIKMDVVFLNSTLELKTAGLTLKSVGCENVIFTRGIPSPIKVDAFKSYLFSKVVSHVVVNSEYVLKSISNIKPLLKHNPCLIYHAIDPQSDKKSDCQSHNIAIVGRLSHEKGVDLAISAMPYVTAKIPDANLWIVGEGKERMNLNQLCTELQIENSVTFHGFSNKVNELLAECSVLVLTSRWEGFGLVLLEAMKLGIPCIAFDHTAASEIIVNGETGYLIPDMDVQRLAEKVIHLLSDPNLCRQMGDKGSKVLSEKFSMKLCIDHYEQLFTIK